MSNAGSFNPLSPAIAPTIFRIAGLSNIIGVMVFSLALTNERLIALSPIVLSRFGLVSIMLWGWAYYAVARSYRTVPGQVAVFAVEKAVYVVTWIIWLQAHGAELPMLLSDSPLTGIFYAVYGALDLLFGAFFALICWRSIHDSDSKSVG